MLEVVVVSFLVSTLFDGAGGSTFGDTESPVEDCGNPKMLFGLGSAITVEPVAGLSLDKGCMKLNLGVVVVGNGVAPKILLLLKEATELDGVPKALCEVLVPFSNELVEKELEVDGNLNGFVGGISVVGAPKVFVVGGRLNGEENGLGLGSWSGAVADTLVVFPVSFPGVSSSEWSVMKSESLPASGGDIGSSLDESSTIPRAAASDAV